MVDIWTYILHIWNAVGSISIAFCNIRNTYIYTPIRPAEAGKELGGRGHPGGKTDRLAGEKGKVSPSLFPPF